MNYAEAKFRTLPRDRQWQISRLIGLDPGRVIRILEGHGVAPGWVVGVLARELGEPEDEIQRLHEDHEDSL